MAASTLGEYLVEGELIGVEFGEVVEDQAVAVGTIELDVGIHIVFAIIATVISFGVEGDRRVDFNHNRDAAPQLRGLLQSILRLLLIPR